jgi:hypothetical protein
MNLPDRYIVSDARPKFERSFVTIAKELLIEGIDWSCGDGYSLFQEEVQSAADQYGKVKVNRTVDFIEVGPSVLANRVTLLNASQELQAVHRRSL